MQKYGQTSGMMTFDDFKKGLAAVSKKDASGKPTVYGENIRNDASYIDAFIYSNGGALLNNDNTKVRFNEPAGVEVYDMWGQLVRPGGLRRPGPRLPAGLRQARRSPPCTTPAPGAPSSRTSSWTRPPGRSGSSGESA